VVADTARGSSPLIVVGDRIVPHSAYRPTPWAEVGDTPGWWAALAFLGGLLVVGGATVRLVGGEATAIGGVLLFFATAVLAGAERTELATGAAVGAMVWTATGISLAMGVDGSPYGTLLALAPAGLALTALGTVRAVGLARARPSG
jgi:hypothetical protein